MLMPVRARYSKFKNHSNGVATNYKDMDRIIQTTQKQSLLADAAAWILCKWKTEHGRKTCNALHFQFKNPILCTTQLGELVLLRANY